MPLDPKLSVPVLLATSPTLADALRRLGFDPTLVPDTLETFCAGRDLPIQWIEDEFSAPPPVPQQQPESHWHMAPLSDLADWIVQWHHGLVRREIPRLRKFLDHARRSSACTSFPITDIEDAFERLSMDLLQHMDVEETHVFPEIRSLDHGGQPLLLTTTVELFDTMRSEHETASQLFFRLAHLTHNFLPPEEAPGAIRALYCGLKDLEKDLHLHIHLENHILFARAYLSREIV